MLPELAVHLLESSAAGCRWMAGHWVDLSAILDERPAWRPADERKAIRLLGKSPDAEDDAEIRALRLAIKVLKQSPHPHIGPLMVPPTEKTAGRPVPTKAEAKAKLQAICARVIERLRDLAARREAQATLPNAAEETLRHGFDESKEAKELRRRKSTAYREMLKALEMLMKLQKQPAIEESEEPSSGLAATFSHGYAGEGRLAKRRDLSKASADGPRPVTRERVRAAGVRVPGQKQRPNRNRVRSMPPEQLGDRGLSPERGNSPNQTRSLGSNSGALS
jgi:hypothetical protein